MQIFRRIEFFLLVGSLWVLGLCLSYDHLPSLDLPHHEAMSAIFSEYFESERESRFTLEWYKRPYLLVYLLALLFAPLMGAPKAIVLVLALSCLSTVWGSYLLLRVCHRDTSWAILPLSVCLSNSFVIGLINFTLGTGMALFCLAALIWHLQKPNARSYFIVLFLSVLVFISHAFAFSWLILGVGLVLVTKLRSDPSLFIKTAFMFLPACICLVLSYGLLWYDLPESDGLYWAPLSDRITSFSVIGAWRRSAQGIFWLLVFLTLLASLYQFWKRKDKEAVFKDQIEVA